MPTSAKWKWFLTDAQNRPKADLGLVTSRQVQFTRNSYSEATGTMLHKDKAAYTLLSMLWNGTIPRLQAIRTGRKAGATPQVRFCGAWAPHSETVEEDGKTIALSFRSPFYGFIGDGSTRGRYTSASGDAFTSQGASTIASTLLQSYGDANPAGAPTTSYLGLDIGSLDIGGASGPQTVSYLNNNVGQAIIDLTKVTGGIDFKERFAPQLFVPNSSDSNENVTLRMAYFDTYGAGLGSDVTKTARFEYGSSTLNNLSAVTRGVDYPINSVLVVGGNNVVGTASDASSIAKYNAIFQYTVSASSITDQDTLDSIASAYLRPDPVKTIAFTPQASLKSCPQVFDDFDLGDTASFSARYESFQESDLAVQINGFTVGVDDSGFETYTVADPLDPDGLAMSDAQILTEVLTSTT